jgi:hypothetical protein
LASLDFNSGVWRIALAWLSWFWMAWHGFAWLGMAWHGLAWTRHGLAWMGIAWHGLTLEAAHRHSLCQKELELVIQASRTSSVLPMDFETSTESGSGAAASGSGAGSEECTLEEIQLLHAQDSNLTLDSRGKAIIQPVRQCDKELLQQRNALIGTGLATAPSHVANPVQSTAIPVASLESISAHNKTIAAAVNAEAVLAAEIFQVQALSNSQAPPQDCVQSQQRYGS